MNISAPIIVALIAAIASLIVAGITFYSTMKNTHEVDKNAKELEALKSDLSEKQAERKARRDYQYEARKHLYQQYEPLLFQLFEQCEIANARIQSLARMAKLKHLGPGGWLSQKSYFENGYYAISTIYFLLSPLMIVKLMQRSLTFVDLTVDPYLNDQYLLAKQLYWSFTDDFHFARLSLRKEGSKPIDPIDYEPDSKGADQQREQSPEKYWRQGIPAGRLDKAVEACIIRDSKEVSRYMSFGEFEEAYTSSQLRKKFDYIANIFSDFHPKTRPVLWRMLITQAHIYEALLSTRQIKLATLDENSRPKLIVKPLSAEARQKLNWRDSPDEATDQQPFEVALMYLQESFVQHLLCLDT